MRAAYRVPIPDLLQHVPQRPHWNVALRVTPVPGTGVFRGPGQSRVLATHDLAAVGVHRAWGVRQVHVDVGQVEHGGRGGVRL